MEPRQHRARTRRCAGFTLIELIVVMSIIVLLIALIVPAYNQVSRASGLAKSGQLVVDQLDLARQAASTGTKLVEVRFYKLPDALGADEQYRAVQVFHLDERARNPQPLGTMVKLTQGVMISGEEKFSSILDPPGTVDPTVIDPSVPSKYVGFRFRPGGAADFASIGPWFITLFFETDAPTAATKTPNNFVCVKVDSLNGRTSVYRP